MKKKKKGKQEAGFHGRIVMAADGEGTVHFFIPTGPNDDGSFSFALGASDAAMFASTIFELLEEHATKIPWADDVEAQVFDLMAERVKREGEQFERTD